MTRKAAAVAAHARQAMLLGEGWEGAVRVEHTSVSEYERLRPPTPELATGRRSCEGKGAATDDSESGCSGSSCAAGHAVRGGLGRSGAGGAHLSQRV